MPTHIPSEVFSNLVAEGFRALEAGILKNQTELHDWIWGTFYREFTQVVNEQGKGI